MNFIIYDSTGAIKRAGSCPASDFALQASADEFIVEGTVDIEKDAIDPQTGNVVKGGRVLPPTPPLNYIQSRLSMYPTIQEQMDMLWHAMDSDPAKRTEPFYSVIKLVKDSNPKPETGTVFNVGEA